MTDHVALWKFKCYNCSLCVLDLGGRFIVILMFELDSAVFFHNYSASTKKKKKSKPVASGHIKIFLCSDTEPS